MAHDNLNITEKQIHAAEQVLPMWRIVLSQFAEHRMAVVGAVIISIYILIGLLAPVIQSVTGLNPEKQNAMARYLPPMSTSEVSSSYKEDSMSKLMETQPEVAQQLQADLISQNLITPEKPEDTLYNLVARDLTETRQIIANLKSEKKGALENIVGDFQTKHILGTDELGRDVLIRTVFGTRVSMTVGILVALAGAIIGLLIGSVAGFYGGWIDTALMRVTDSLLSLPQLPVLIIMAATDLQKLIQYIPFGQSLLRPGNESIVKLFFVLVLFSWMTVARLVRASVLSLREREFILAAKTLGAKDRTIILGHLFPNVIAPLLVSVSLGIGESIKYEASLSFLGLGIQPPTPSWGNMLFNAQELISEAPFLAIIPGLQILLVVMSFNYIGDGLQDAIDPKAVRR